MLVQTLPPLTLFFSNPSVGPASRGRPCCCPGAVLRWTLRLAAGYPVTILEFLIILNKGPHISMLHWPRKLHNLSCSSATLAGSETVRTSPGHTWRWLAFEHRPVQVLSWAPGARLCVQSQASPHSHLYIGLADGLLRDTSQGTRCFLPGLLLPARLPGSGL